MNDAFDLAILGGGPGGQAAAHAAISHGLRVAILDEQAQPGGQIWRQPFADDLYPPTRFGPAHRAARGAARDLCAQSGVTWLGGRTVWGVLPAGDEGFDLHHSGPDGSERLFARKVLVAAGCHDMAVPFPGWTLPGVMGAGGIQAMLKGQGLVPGKRIFLGGSHPLMLVVAAQLLDFGVVPAGVAFVQSRRRVLGALRQPVTALRHAPILLQGLHAYRKLARAGVPVQFGKVACRAEGSGSLESITLAPADRADGAEEQVACDTFGFCYGFTASSEVPRQAGANAIWSETGGGWIISHDENMKSSVEGLYVAGETAGIGGEPSARAEGHLAGLAVAAGLGRAVPQGTIAAARRQRRSKRQFTLLLRRLADPGSALLRGLRDDDTLLCRCESVRTGTFRSLLRDNPTIRSADAAKLLARTGMGQCQGRFCHRAMQEEIAMQRGVTVAEAGAMTARLPARPVPLSNMRGAGSGRCGG